MGDRTMSLRLRAGLVMRLVWEKKIDFVAASITYYAFFSMVPLLLLSFIVLSRYTTEAVARNAILGTAAFMPPLAQDIIETLLIENIAHSEATIIGIVILLWASLQLFRGFDIAFSSVYDTPTGESVLAEVKDAMTSLFTLAIAIMITTSAGAVISAFPGIELVGVIWTIAQFIGLTAIFLPLYHVFTDVPFSWRELLPGALTAAAGWTLLQGLFALYTTYLGGSVYEGFGGLLLLIFWMYLGNVCILLGAVVNLVEHEQIEPRTY